MRTKLDNWNNGWIGIELGIRRDEIDPLIALLTMLKNDPDQHFHISSDYKESEGVGDIEIYVQSTDEESNMILLGRAIAPGSEIDGPNA